MTLSLSFLLKPLQKNELSVLIANTLEHYDSALFVILIPFLTPHFFPHLDPLTALIQAYFLTMASLFFRPLGAIFFGWIGDRKNREKSFYLSFMGLTAATFLIAFLPTYDRAGWLAPLFLMSCRWLQSFCMGGASSGGALLLLEKKEKRGFLSALYALSTISGIFLASITLPFCATGDRWRMAFCVAALLSLTALLLKRAAPLENNRIKHSVSFSIPMLMKSILLSGFSYITYSIPFVLMNCYLPMITNATALQVADIGIYLIIIDMIAIMAIAPLMDRFKASSIMFLAVIILCVVAIPLWYWHLFFLLRLVIVICGVAFSLPFYSWMIESVPFHHRYRLVAVGGAIGAELLGKSSIALCLWLYQKTHIQMVPAIYLTFFALVVLWILRKDHQYKGVGGDNQRIFKWGG